MLESVSNNNVLEYQKLSKEEMEKRGILGRLVGICADFLSPTRNGRQYPEKLWENVFNDPIMKERIENGVCYGELGHPADREETDMEKIAVCMAEVPKKGTDGKLRAVFDILNTPNGKILKSLCDYGSTIGISSRGSGDLETDFDGNESVNPDTYTCEGFDVVLIPAVKEARLQYVTESLNKTRYNKTLRDKLTESINSEDESHQKIMRESLDTLGIKLDDKSLKDELDESYEYDNYIIYSQWDENNDCEEWIIKDPSGNVIDVCDSKEECEEEIDSFRNDMNEISDLVESLLNEDTNKNNNLEYEHSVDKHSGAEYNYYKLGYIDKVNCSASEYIKHQWNNSGYKYYVQQHHPYDDAEYTWAYSDDGKNWTCVKNGKKTNKFTTDLEDFISVAKKIISQDKGKVQPRMVHESIKDSDDENSNLNKNNDAKIIDECDNNQKADDNNMAIMNELHESYKLNKKLDEMVNALQTKLSASYTRENKLKEELDRNRNTIKKLSMKSKQLNAVNEKLNILEKDNASMNASRKKLTESITKKNNSVSMLNESIEKQKQEIKSLKEQLEQKENEYDALNTELHQYKESYETKFNEKDELIEKYQNIAIKSVGRYIDNQAKMLGVTSAEIKNRLPESYSFSDIDAICEDLRDYKIKVNNLPFSTTTNHKLNENVNVRVKNVDKRTLVPNFDDDVDELTMRLAGF